jgi:hypothetical protein
MGRPYHFSIASVGVASLLFVSQLSAQNGTVEGRGSGRADQFKARLSPTPVESSTFASITGSGSATASLTGRRLVVRGTFEGMKAAATIGQIHLGPRGVRGPVMFDLVITKAAAGAGTFTGTFNLTPELVEGVKASRFYIQIHSEKATEGNLWGWLLPVSP